MSVDVRVLTCTVARATALLVEELRETGPIAACARVAGQSGLRDRRKRDTYRTSG